MLFALMFQDDPDRLAVRQRYLAAHIDWLAQNAEVIKVAGSLRAQPNDSPEGGLWIVEAEDVGQIEALIAKDPFTLNRLRRGWAIRHWSKAFPDRFKPV